MLNNPQKIFAIRIATVFIVLMFAGALHAQIELQDGVFQQGQIVNGGWNHYYIDVADNHTGINIYMGNPKVLGRVRKSNPDVYVRFGAQPTLSEWDFRPRVFFKPEEVEINSSSTPKLKTGRYYISVYSANNAAYRLKATRDVQPSQHTGMGARPYDGGTAFRVWAPNADAVNVVGEFNDWNLFAAPMYSENNGYWSIDHRDAVAGQKYMYVIENGGNTYWKRDPYEEEVENSSGDTVIFDNEFDWTDQLFQMPTWNEMVIYEMHIGTFNDSPGGGPGNFDSAIARLDHVKDLGCNTIGLLPCFEFAGDFSWGYNPACPFAIEQAYGGPKALKRFVDAAHQRGLAVTMDVVNNHWGPSDLDHWQFDGWSENGRGGIYFYQDNRAETQWGDTRPDYGRTEVRQYIRDSVMNLLEEFHIDGIRWDSVKYTRLSDYGDLPDGWSLMQWINDEVNFYQPWKIMIGEDMQNNAWVTKDTGEGGAGFDTQWTAQFVHPVRSNIIAQNDNDRNMYSIRDAIQQRFNTDAFERVIYTESHDEVANGKSRVPEEIWPGNAASWFSKKRSSLGAALVMTSPGIPMIFQGQEILEDGYFHDDDPIDWTKATTNAGINLLYRDMIRLRRNWNNNTRGLRGQHLNVHHVNNNDKLLAFHRWDQGGNADDVIVVLNFKDQAQFNYRIGLPSDGVWRVRFNSDWVGYSSDFGDFWSPDVTGQQTAWDGMPASGTLQIAPYSVLILSKD